MTPWESSSSPWRTTTQSSGIARNTEREVDEELLDGDAEGTPEGMTAVSDDTPEAPEGPDTETADETVEETQEDGSA